jgi:hypothetical protein
MGYLKRMNAVLGTAGVLCLSAQADILQLDSNVHAGANSNSMVFHGNSFADLATPHSLLGDFAAGTGASSQADLEYDFAQLHAKVSGTRTAGGNGANAAGELLVLDLCTITSSTLPQGTLVDVTFNLQVHVNFIHPAGWSQNGFDDVVYTLGDTGSNSVHGELRDTATDTISFTQHTAIGVSTFLTYTLLTTASAPGDPGGTTTVDAFNTANLYVTSSIPGADVTSGCGLVYASSPVPEPSTCLALGLGAIALVRRRRRA